MSPFISISYFLPYKGINTTITWLACWVLRAMCSMSHIGILDVHPAMRKLPHWNRLKTNSHQKMHDIDQPQKVSNKLPEIFTEGILYKEFLQLKFSKIVARNKGRKEYIRYHSTKTPECIFLLNIITNPDKKEIAWKYLGKARN